MVTPNFCTQCGVAAQPGAAFCANCGTHFAGSAFQETTSSETRGELALTTELRYMTPLSRVLVMSVLSYGFYLLYWFYLTWKQYRDHTGREVYPIWHALTLFVPIYGLFRVHAHMRAFAEIAAVNGVVTRISPGWAVVAVFVSGYLSGISARIYGFSLEVVNITQQDAVLVAIVDLFAIAIVTWMVLHAQANINVYWNHRLGDGLRSVRVGVVEVIIALFGVLAWGDTIANLFSESYRSGL